MSGVDDVRFSWLWVVALEESSKGNGAKGRIKEACIAWWDVVVVAVSNVEWPYDRTATRRNSGDGCDSTAVAADYIRWSNERYTEFARRHCLCSSDGNLRPILSFSLGPRSDKLGGNSCWLECRPRRISSLNLCLQYFVPIPNELNGFDAARLAGLGRILYFIY